MNDAYAVTANELRQFIERYEQLESEKQDVAEIAKRHGGGGHPNAAAFRATQGLLND